MRSLYSVIYCSLDIALASFSIAGFSRSPGIGCERETDDIINNFFSVQLGKRSKPSATAGGGRSKLIAILGSC